MTSSWRDKPLVRVLGSAGSWFLFALCFTLLIYSVFAVMLLGGSCASGGPYEIAVECPDAVVIFTPLSIFGGLAAVAIGVALAQGYGTPMATWGWPILFCGLGALFLAAFFAAGDIVGLIIGLMFVIMGAIPLVLELRGNPQRVFLGQTNAAGVQFLEGERARPTMMSRTFPNPEGAVAPTVLNWIASLGIAVAMSFAGYQLAMLMLSAVVNASVSR